ncbi:MAG: adenylate kinase [Candidatus Altiarchaeota archaeon]|nr:adenylate kinase [Candidatus Altiarchaeota archaeon]
MLCVVFGIPGVGKTTVLDEVAERVDVNRLNFGTFMFEEAKAKGLVEDRDQMRKLPKEAQSKLQKTAAEKIYKQSRSGNVIVDTHASVKTPQGYIPGLPEAVLRALSPDALVIVECDPRDILGRRNRDRSRERDADALEEIDEHQSINRSYGAVYSDLTNSTLMIVKNAEGKVADAAEKIALIFKQ